MSPQHYKRAAARDVRAGDVVYMRRRWREVTSVLTGPDVVALIANGRDPRNRHRAGERGTVAELAPGAVVRIRTSTPPARRPMK